jgi:hypothetical protein
MGLYKINENDVAQRVRSEDIDYEQSFENWLENTPSLLFDDDDASERLLWIGRQSTASVGDSTKYPDLIGIDADGDLVIVELKKGKTPRDVVAQILEYASWGHDLSYDDLNNMYLQYTEEPIVSLIEAHSALFEPEVDLEESHFNRKQKLFIVAEKIDPTVKQVSNYLCDVYKVDINHLEYEVMKTKQNETIVSVRKSFGYVKATIPSETTDRWAGRNLGNLVHNAALSLVKKHGDTFTIKDVVDLLKKDHPALKRDTLGSRITQDCVNHSSRKHLPSGQRDYYFRVEKGVYRLYDPATDGKWNWEGRRIE